MKLFLPNGTPHEVPPEPETPPPPAEGAPQPYEYIDEAIQIAVQCWQDKETQDIPMNERLAAAFARRLAGWIQRAADGWQGAEFYRGIIDQCGAAIGIEAYTSDDGSIQEDVLALKLPELVKKLVEFEKDRNSKTKTATDSALTTNLPHFGPPASTVNLPYVGPPAPTTKL